MTLLRSLLAIAVLITPVATQAGVVWVTDHETGSVDVPGPFVADIRDDDLLQIVGVIATQTPGPEAGDGWHELTPVDERFETVTDGLPPVSALTGLLNDFAGAPITTFDYQLDEPRDIGEIRVITGNYNNADGRIFTTFIAEASNDGGQTYFGIGGADPGTGPTGYYQSDESGKANVLGNGNNVSGDPDLVFNATRVRIFNDEDAALLDGITHLRFQLFSVSNTVGEMRDPFDGTNPFTGTDDGLAAAFESPLLWEIDVRSTQDLIGDMDFDDDVDFDDIAPFAVGLNSPSEYESNFGLPPKVRGDIDRDGDFDFDDIPGFVALLGGGTASAQAVPEPSTLLLVAGGLLGLLGLLARSRRRD